MAGMRTPAGRSPETHGEHRQSHEAVYYEYGYHEQPVPPGVGRTECRGGQVGWDGT